MKRRLLLATLVIGLVALCGQPARSDGAGMSSSIDNGFGSAKNSYSWSMGWFKDKLYVGTARSQLCVEGATIDFYQPGYYKSPIEGFPEVDCPADRYDMDLRAEIWQFDPTTSAWTRVFRSPADIPNPRAPGKFLARDIGFRNMVVYRGALYVAGVTSDEYVPEIAASHPPRILRTTDGTHFTAVNGSPGILNTPFGPQRAMGYRAMVNYKGRLFVTAGGGLTGDGVILEVKSPASRNPAFVQVSPPSMAVFEMESFNGSLYVGLGNGKTGYSVWKTDAGSPARFTEVVPSGVGRGSSITSVVAMHVFKGRLYVTASGWAFVFPASELIRINPDDSFDLVTGNARRMADGSWKFPISGLPDGFGNLFNGHFWRVQDHGGALYLGTNDWSWAFRSWPIVGPWLKPENGFDVYGSCDGQYWFTLTRDAFGAGTYNFGARTMASTPAGGFIGSANHVEGTTVWRDTDASPCGPGAVIPSSKGLARASRTVPQRLLADAQRRGVVLSWAPVRRARSYRVERAAYRIVRNVPSPDWGDRSGTFVPETPPAMHAGGSTTDVPVAGGYRRIGSTRRHRFVERTARRGVRYLYRVIAVKRSGKASAASNTVLVPSARPAVTFAEAVAALQRLAPSRAAGLRRLLRAARRRWGRADRAGTLRQLAQVTRSSAQLASTSGVARRSAEEDVRDVVLRLRRRLQYAGVAGG